MLYGHLEQPRFLLHRMSTGESVFKPLLRESAVLKVDCLVLNCSFPDQSVGYGVVVGMLGCLYVCFSTCLTTPLGVGFFFAALMLLLTFLQSKFSDRSPSSSEEFSVRLSPISCFSTRSDGILLQSASRSVKVSAVGSFPQHHH